MNTNKCEQLADRMLALSKKLRSHPIATSMVSLAVVIVAAITIAVFSQNTNPTAETAPTPDKNLRTLIALRTEGITTSPTGDYLGTNSTIPQVYTGNPALSWDKFFTDKCCWDDLPIGSWELESRTDTVLKYSAREVQPFLITPDPDSPTPTRIHIRVSIKTGRVISAEIIWLSLSSGQVTAPPQKNPPKATGAQKIPKQVLDAQKKMTEDQRDPSKPIRRAVATELGKRFPQQKTRIIGSTPVFQTEVTDYETPGGLNIRFWKNEPGLVLAVIQPIEDAGNKLGITEPVSHGLSGWAKTNVVRLPNHDVLIKNLPMDELFGSSMTVSCGATAQAMICEYWGQAIPLELIWAKTLFPPKDGYLDAWEPCAKEIGIKTGKQDIAIHKIIQEIDEGRPVVIAHWMNETRKGLHAQWKKEVAADPEFKIPNPKTAEEKKQ